MSKSGKLERDAPQYSVTAELTKLVGYNLHVMKLSLGFKSLSVWFAF